MKKLKRLNQVYTSNTSKTQKKKYYQGVIAWGPDKGDAYYSKLPSEMEAEAEKMVKEFMDRNS